MAVSMPAIDSLPERRGPRPRTTPANPHQQLDQNAPPGLQEALFERARALPGVRVGPSGISVPGARAFILDEELAAGAPEAFMIGREFAHLHPPYDGSLHLMLPEATARVVAAKGWGELHPVARRGWLPPTAMMVYGPRDDDELEVVWTILQASYAFARGAQPGGRG
ncbi:luciferase domain-containing protein [Thermaerobacter litoralis]